jgi:ribosome biogenesis GTPase
VEIAAVKEAALYTVFLCPFSVGENQRMFYKLSQKRRITLISLKKYGFTAEGDAELNGEPARVTAVHRERYEVVSRFGEIFARLKSSVYYNDSGEDFPTVGDFVLLQYEPYGDSLILKTLPRKSLFSRSDFSGHAVGYVKTIIEQTVAANFDYVFIMASLNNDFNVSRIERYLTAAWQSGATPVVLLTKSDLAPEPSEQISAAKAAAPGVEVIACSSVNGMSLDRLRALIALGKTAVFLGSSGVGKSSLLNALAGEKLMDVKAIREDDSRGRHTTTHRQLFMLPHGGMIIDTPGMRELGMWDVSEGLGGAFSDVEEVLSRPCKFSDCRHVTEPGCAVKAALELGELSPARWEHYNNLKREAKFTEDKSGFLREKSARNKSLAMWSKENKKN